MVYLFPLLMASVLFFIGIAIAMMALIDWIVWLFEQE